MRGGGAKGETGGLYETLLKAKKDKISRFSLEPVPSPLGDPRYCGKCVCARNNLVEK